MSGIHIGPRADGDAGVSAKFLIRSSPGRRLCIKIVYKEVINEDTVY